MFIRIIKRLIINILNFRLTDKNHKYFCSVTYKMSYTTLQPKSNSSKQNHPLENITSHTTNKIATPMKYGKRSDKMSDFRMDTREEASESTNYDHNKILRTMEQKTEG
jgi:hypothetical protein